MATKKPVIDNLTVAVAQKEEEQEVPRARIFLPRLEDSDGRGMTVDQYEHVSISNEVMEDNTRILRGEWVDVTVPVFMNLKEKYPNL